jgi:hypothetical protein
MLTNPRSFEASASAVGIAFRLALKLPAALNSTFLLVIVVAQRRSASGVNSVVYCA